MAVLLACLQMVYLYLKMCGRLAMWVCGSAQTYGFYTFLSQN
jgi:hypothetical protein